MSNAKHTAGPWTNDGENRHYGFTINAPGSKPEYHVTVCDVMGQADEGQTAANVALILAAPEMKDLLQKIVEHGATHHGVKHCVLCEDNLKSAARILEKL